MLLPHHSSSSAMIGQRRNCRKGWAGLFMSSWLCAFRAICKVSDRNLLAANDTTIIIPAVVIVELLMISLPNGLLFIYIFSFPFFSCTAVSAVVTTARA